MTTPIRIAITGGIGSGKSYVSRCLEKFGVIVYDCDTAAKRLMRTSRQLQEQLTEIVGSDILEGGRLQKRKLVTFLLASESNKQRINDIVHPAVAADFMASGMTWLESAILFESSFYKRVKFDYIVCVTAPDDIRAKRVAKRDGISIEKATEWIDCQLSQEEMVKRSDFVINNDGTADIENQITNIIQNITKTKDK